MQVPRQSHRYSGRTAMRANVNVHEPKQPVDSESVLSFSGRTIRCKGCDNIMPVVLLGILISFPLFQEEVSGDLKQGNTVKVLLHCENSGSYLEIKVDTSSSNDGLELSSPPNFRRGELSAKSAAIQKRMVDLHWTIKGC